MDHFFHCQLDFCMFSTKKHSCIAPLTWSLDVFGDSVITSCDQQYRWSRRRAEVLCEPSDKLSLKPAGFQRNKEHLVCNVFKKLMIGLKKRLVVCLLTSSSRYEVTASESLGLQWTRQGSIRWACVYFCVCARGVNQYEILSYHTLMCHCLHLLHHKPVIL